MSNDSDRPYWNMDIETKFNTPEMLPIQLEGMQKRIEFLYNSAPFWKARLDEYGVKPGDLKDMADFAKMVPVFDKAQFALYAMENQLNMDKMLPGLLGEEDFNRLIMIAATSGTTGEPTPYPLTPSDMEMWAESNARMAWRCGLRPGQHRVVFAFGLSMFLAGVPGLIAMSRMGVCTIPVGAEAGTERIIHYAQYFKGNVLGCTPSLAEHMIEKAPQVMGGDPISTLGINIVMCGGEPGAGLPEVRKKIEESYGAKLFDAGAGLGVSCDWPEYMGMHSIGDDILYYELVDPDTYEPIKMEEGAMGMAVFTPLVGSAMAGLRQTIGDVHQVFMDPCPCGRSGWRYKVLGRTDDMLKVKGVMIYPAGIDDVIAAFHPRVTGEFRIVLKEPPPRVVPPLNLKIEYGADFPKEKLDELGEEILDAMSRKIKIRPAITWVEPFSLERFDHKTKFIEKDY